MELTKRYVSLWALHKILKAPEFEAQSVQSFETVRRRAHRGAYGPLTPVVTATKVRRHFRVDLLSAHQLLFSYMPFEQFVEVVNRQLEKSNN